MSRLSQPSTPMPGCEWMVTSLSKVPVEVPKTVVKEVEKELSWLQQTLIYIGLAVIVYLIGKLVLKFIKRRFGK
jgi:hypothetical protein